MSIDPRGVTQVLRHRYYDVMLCPFCDDNNVHHQSVTVYERDSEDGESVYLYSGDQSPAWRDCSQNYANPSDRRNGLGIKFWCESGHEWVMYLAQHKGETHITYEFLKLAGDAETELSTMPYAQYLKTEHWQNVRKAALERADYRCQACNEPDNLHVHHRTYENRGCERDSDVTVLCKSCHERFHEIVGASG